MSVFSHLFWCIWSALESTKLQLFWWIHLYWCFFFSLWANYRIYTATIYVIKSSENLPFLSILLYVIRTIFDKVTVFSFWYSFHSVQNRCKQFDRARWSCLYLLTFPNTTKAWCAPRIVWTPAQVQTMLGAHHRLVIIFSENKGFYVALPIMVQITWFFLHHVHLSCKIIVKWQ